MSNEAIQKTFFSESKILLVLAIPLILTAIVETSVSFFSTIFLAHLGKESLAAAALAGWIFATIMMIVWGTFSAISTLVARYYGRQDPNQIQNVLCASLVLAAVLATPTMALLWNLAPILLFFRQDPKIVALAEPYFHALTWAIIPDFIYLVGTQFVAGLGRTKINLGCSLLYVPLCIFFNYVLVFGVFGFPKLGIAGIGWGAALSFWVIAILLSTYLLLKKDLRVYLRFTRAQKIVGALKEVLQVGLPLGLMYFVEIGFFLVMTILMGLISLDTISANQVTLQFFFLFTIVTYALCQGITIRVGHSVGKNDKKAIHYATYIGLFYACSYELLIALIYWKFPNTLIGIDFNINDPKNTVIVHLAQEFMSITALVQIVEALRFVYFGSLRGLSDTRFSLLITIFIFGLVALPLSYLAIFFGFAGVGIWWAILLGEILGIPLLIWRYHRKVNQHLW